MIRLACLTKTNRHEAATKSGEEAFKYYRRTLACKYLHAAIQRIFYNIDLTRNHPRTQYHLQYRDALPI